MELQCSVYVCPERFEDKEGMKKHLEEEHPEAYKSLYEEDTDEDDEDDEDDGDDGDDGDGNNGERKNGEDASSNDSDAGTKRS